MEGIEKILDDFGKQLVKDVRDSWNAARTKKAAENKSPVNANSRLNASMDYEVEYDDKGVYMVFRMAPHYVWVDKGRKPGNVSREGQKKIGEWIKRNGLTPKLSKPVSTKIRKIKTKSIKKAFKESELEKRIKSAVFLISRKIKNKGYDASYFYSNVINDGRLDKLREQIAKEFKKDINIVFKTN